MSFRISRPSGLSRRVMLSAVGSGLVGCLAGCLNFKPASPSTRYFVLTAQAGPGPATNSPPGLTVGLGQVKLPAYLLQDGLAVRQGTNELEYLEDARWAERLDLGFQRVLAADLAALLPAQSVRLSTWDRTQVHLEFYVTVEQFDLDQAGRGVLAAGWRMVAPGGGRVLAAGRFQNDRLGPAPRDHPGNAVATLSELIADLARAVAGAAPGASPK